MGAATNMSHSLVPAKPGSVESTAANSVHTTVLLLLLLLLLSPL